MLIVVRHGRTEANAAGLLLGRTDPPLDERGRTQALALAGAVADPDGVDRVVASPLRRARETAECLGMPVEVDDRWIELDYGRYDGLATDAVPAETWAAWRSDPAFRPPGGESLAELGSRVRAAADDLVADAIDGTVVVVTHVSPVKAALAWALGAGDHIAWRAYVAPASITRIAIGPAGPVLRSFNDTCHL